MYIWILSSHHSTFFRFSTFHTSACNIMVEGTAPFYKLTNFDSKKNCSITAMFPAVVSVKAIDVGAADSKSVNYDVSFFSSSSIDWVWVRATGRHALCAKGTNPSTINIFDFNLVNPSTFFRPFVFVLFPWFATCSVQQRVIDWTSVARKI